MIIFVMMIGHRIRKSVERSLTPLIRGPATSRKMSVASDKIFLSIGRAHFVKIVVVIMVELVQVHMSIAFNHFLVLIRVSGVLQVVLDIVPLVEFSCRGIFLTEVMNGIPILASMHGIEMRIRHPSHIVPDPPVGRGVRRTPRQGDPCE